MDIEIIVWIVIVLGSFIYRMYKKSFQANTSSQKRSPSSPASKQDLDKIKDLFKRVENTVPSSTDLKQRAVQPIPTNNIDEKATDIKETISSTYSPISSPFVPLSQANKKNKRTFDIRKAIKAKIILDKPYL